MVHFTKTLGVALSSAAVLVAAKPMAAPVPTAAPNLNDARALQKRASCTFTGSDASAASASAGSCSTVVISGMTVPSGTTLDLSDLADGSTVIFEGTTTWEYEEWSGPLLQIKGTDITVTGASGNVLDGNGAKWWDGEGSNGGVTKPKFFYAHSLKGSSSITGLNIQNTPVQAISINSAEGLTVDSVTIDNSAGDSDDLGHNTDCYDVGSSSDITITNAVCKNQDDCLAINSGTSISFTGGTCSGGHGLSIGSVGGRDDNDVDTVTISDCSVSDSDNGVRIKTVSDATGTVKGVTYKDITLDNIAKYGIVIEQDYENGSPTGTPTDGVPITDLTIDTVTGSVASSGVNVYILCASCSSWTWSGVDITGGEDSSDCEGVPTGASC
ncbi:hypothetical protein BP6252_13789 [Coleophoma cylindrospora]|uniref:endo-polygalacturonase n=1 Tax=Coleophoma cylindrospora TaxID=1849047 RepID=A0A3D8Q6K7_9HELO|nr:hypothetical protein BP6252_13789 [Coleophoma cylindrospora]